MPTLFLSPSTQHYNPYLTQGNERFWMNQLADRMVPILESSGITVVRNDPEGSAARSIRDSNALSPDFHLALHSNAAGEALFGQLTGIDLYYYPTSRDGARMAALLAESLKEIYPDPAKVTPRTSTVIGEVRRTAAPSVLCELGYHDNAADEAWIIGNLDAIAVALCQGVTEYFSLPLVFPEEIS